MYADDYKTLHGLRILAVDGSKVILPNNKETRATFGVTKIKNKKYEGTYTCALASVLFDVLNGVALDAQLTASNVYEGTAAISHMRRVEKDDLVIFDRGYCAYRVMEMMAQTKGDFLIRGNDNSFTIVNEMLKGGGPSDITMVIHDPHPQRERSAGSRRPSLEVRFVRVTLDTGEYEVLATSLTDTEKYPSVIFKELYWKRWGVETFYRTLKDRLSLEHFTGISVESVLQDFHAAVFLTGLESILTEDSDVALSEKETMHPQQVNQAVSFNAIKHRAFDLFMSDVPIDEVVDELTDLFSRNPTLYRKDKNPERKPAGLHRLLNFWQRVKRFVF
jgi:hypothetical protein